MKHNGREVGNEGQNEPYLVDAVVSAAFQVSKPLEVCYPAVSQA